MKIGIIGRVWITLAATGLILSSEAAATVFTQVEGSVVLDQSCEKTTFADLKLLVRQDSPIDYSHNQKVDIQPDGRFKIYVVPSYNYIFQLLRTDNSDLLISGVGRYEPMHSNKNPVISAKCTKKPKEEKT